MSCFSKLCIQHLKVSPPEITSPQNLCKCSGELPTFRQLSLSMQNFIILSITSFCSDDGFVVITSHLAQHNPVSGASMSLLIFLWFFSACFMSV